MTLLDEMINHCMATNGSGCGNKKNELSIMVSFDCGTVFAKFESGTHKIESMHTIANGEYNQLESSVCRMLKLLTEKVRESKLETNG